MIEAYQEQLIALEELRGRMPQLRKRERPHYRRPARRRAARRRDYIKLPENLEGFLARLADTADTVGHPRAPTRQAPHRRTPAAPPRPRPATPATPLAAR